MDNKYDNEDNILTEEKKYLISDAAHEIKVETHVLRYWEEELGLKIQRNEMGHRMYSRKDIEYLCFIRNLRDKDFQLKVIKHLLPCMDRLQNLDEEKLMALKDKLNGLLGSEDNSESQYRLTSCEMSKTTHDKKSVSSQIDRFRDIMSGIMQDVLTDNNEKLTKDLTLAVKNNVIKEIDYLFRTREELEEERFRRFDRALRDIQTARQQTAAANEGFLKKKYIRK